MIGENTLNLLLQTAPAINFHTDIITWKPRMSISNNSKVTFWAENYSTPYAMIGDKVFIEILSKQYRFINVKVLVENFCDSDYYVWSEFSGKVSFDLKIAGERKLSCIQQTADSQKKIVVEENLNSIELKRIRNIVRSIIKSLNFFIDEGGESEKVQLAAKKLIRCARLLWL
jgi:hypothetical protein